MENLEILEYEWPYLLTFLPPHDILESTAKRFGALIRKRDVDSAETLLRLAFVYACCQKSLRETAAWAAMCNLADISDVALLHRLENAGDWLGHLLALKLAERAVPPSFASSAHFRIRIIDATCISKPGSTAADWRLHLVFNLARLTIDQMELTDHTGSESLTRFPFAPGDLVLANRGYGHRTGLHAVCDSGADFLVRIAWRTMPLQHPDGTAFNLLAALRSLSDGLPGEFATRLARMPGTVVPILPVRLLAIRKSETAASQARAQALRARSKKGRNVHPSTLEAAGYTFVLTSVPAELLRAEEGLDLYRFRWQIELAFKRLKSLMHLAHLPAKGDQLGKSILYAKLLAALIVEDLTENFLDFSPWGYRLRTTPTITLVDPASTD